MTALDLDAIKARADAATEGPWMADESHVLKPDKPGSNWDGTVIATVPDDEFGLYEFRNVEFMAAAREDIPALVAEVERLREQADRNLRAYLSVQGIPDDLINIEVARRHIESEAGTTSDSGSVEPK